MAWLYLALKCVKQIFTLHLREELVLQLVIQVQQSILDVLR